MTSDSVRNRTFKETFHLPVRFEIPFFQRGYAWEKKQWDQLFLDLQEQIIAEISDPNSGSSIDEMEHFFGPIVVLEKTGGDVKEYLVIDGQQRITTVYLLLGVIQEQMRTKKHLSSDAADFVAKLGRYLVNDVESADDYLKLKVFSCKGDRLPTYRVIFGSEANPKTPLLQTDLQLYVPGKNRVDEFRKYALKKLNVNFTDVPSLWQLAQVLLNCLKIVWIPLDAQKDDPQAIFESLNEKGMRLTASELLCNFLFRPIIDSKESYEDLHNSQWLAAIRLLENNDQFEDYLRNLFSIGESKMIGKDRKVYIHFKSKNKNLTSASAKQHLAEIYSGASLYRNISQPLSHPHKNEPINQLLVAIGHTRMESSTPFILSVLKAHASGALNDANAQAILKETLVLLVRRKMTELPTTQYDVMFPALLGKVINETNQIRALQEQFKKSAVWVSDQDFQSALINKATYRSRDLPFGRMVLMEIDKRFQTHGQFPDYSTVNTIEHMLPQTIDDAWKNYLGVDANDEHLEALTHTLGNLCLLSGPANSSVGQDPFESKRIAYSPITALARQIKEHVGPWNLAAIRERSKKLSEHAIVIWPWSNV